MQHALGRHLRNITEIVAKGTCTPRAVHVICAATVDITCTRIRSELCTTKSQIPKQNTIKTTRNCPLYLHGRRTAVGVCARRVQRVVMKVCQLQHANRPAAVILNSIRAMLHRQLRRSALGIKVLLSKTAQMFAAMHAWQLYARMHTARRIAVLRLVSTTSTHHTQKENTRNSWHTCVGVKATLVRTKITDGA